jgi:hypothetical protein
MAQIKQIGPGRKTSGTIDGITYVTRNGKTYVRSTPTMPIRAYRTPAALKRQAIFKMVQMHMKYHLRTIRQTFTPKGNGSAVNRYYSVNGKALTKALEALADRLVAGEDITLTEVEAAIAAYATEHPEAIRIGKLSGYGEVFLTGAWPDTITLNANGGDSTIIVIVAENGSTTTIEPNGSTVVVSGSNDSGSNGSNGSGTGGTSGTSGTSDAVAAPVISGTTPFAESTSATISCATAGASIYYTVDGSTPTSASTAYSEALTITDTTTVKAIAIMDGVSSSVTSRTFTKSSGGGSGEDPESE